MTAINAIVIQHKMLLIVRKKETWILPGGKPEFGEDDELCLRREIKEELAGSEIKDIRFYEKFYGETPHTRNSLECRTYFADIDGIVRDVSKNDSVSAYAWMNKEESAVFPLSNVTRKIVESLIKKCYL